MKQKSVIRINRILSPLIILIALTMSLCAAQGDQQSSDSDMDQDGLPDYWEEEYFGNITNYSASDDPDGDGLTNLEEYQNGTNPTNKDTDADEMPDDWEATHGLNPKNATDAYADMDGDGYTNLDEFLYNTDPNDKTSPSDMKKSDSDDEGAGLDTMALPVLLFGVPAVVILLAIIFVYTKMRREQLLEHKVRANIFDYINKNPGVHYRGIMNDLNLQMGVLTHHLNMLEQEKYIKSAQDGMYRRFYPFNASVNSGLVLNEVQQRILQYIRDRPGISQADLARNLGYTRKVVYYHVKILSNAGFIHVETAGRESRCFYIEGLDLTGQPIAGAQVQVQSSQAG
jgi:DNA-binding MarR family transcriptional regulator